MPDNDRIKHRPSRKFGAGADGLADEGRPLSEVAKDVAEAIASTLRCFGDEPIHLIDAAVIVAREILQDERLRIETDWVHESYRLDEQLRQTWGNRDGLELSLDVCKAAYLDLQHGAAMENPMLYTVTEYVWKVYFANFAESLPLDAIYGGSDPIRLAEREHELRPYMKVYIDAMARRIAKSGRARNLKVPRLGEKKHSVMDDLYGNYE